MLRQRSYHDHYPNVSVEYSASILSRWGFFPAILRYLHRLKLPQRLKGVTIPSAPQGLRSKIAMPRRLGRRAGVQEYDPTETS